MPSVLSAGQMDRRIVLQTAQTQQSESGEVTQDWAHADEESLWAEWIPGTTREGLQVQRQIESYIDGVYRIHYRAEPLPDQTRIIGHDDRVYDVKPAIEIDRKRGWIIPVVARGEM